MPNQRREGTHTHSFACPDDLWATAQQRAAERGESVSDVIRRALERYVRQEKR